MKKFFFLATALLMTSVAFAQEGKAKPSPTATATGKIGDKTVTIVYAQPAVKGRAVWGKLVPMMPFGAQVPTMPRLLKWIKM